MDKDDEEFLDDLLKSLGHLDNIQKTKAIRGYIDLMNPRPNEDDIKRYLWNRNLPLT